MPETLAQLREMMPEAAVRQIYAAIVADLARRIAALETAIANRDAAEIRRIGHAIKGGCGMAGALQAARLGACPSNPPGRLTIWITIPPAPRFARRRPQPGAYAGI